MSELLPLHIRQNLRNLGFSDNDILVLSYLFHAKKSTLKDISRQTAVSFSTCHYITANLARLGILEVGVQEGAEYFRICSHQDFLNWIDEKRLQMDEQYRNTQKEIQQFLVMEQESSWKPSVTYFEGVEGLRDIYQDMISTGKAIRGWTDIELIRNTIGQQYMDDFIQRRIENNIETFAIMPDNPTNREYSKKKEKRQTKLVKHFPLEGEIRIYGNKVGAISFDKKTPVGFIMEGKTMAEIYRSIFELAWNEIN
ncbi:MAG: hypothetical protein Q8O95_05245 [bacterium]|nr:hypothetical protein [bacterium]